MDISKNTIRLFGFDIFAGSLSDIDPTGNKKTVINTINAYSYVISKKDKSFREALQNSDILLPDGFPIVFAVKYRKRRQIQKIAGEDVFLYLLRGLNESSGKVFLLGASQNTLDKMTLKFHRQYPKIEVNCYSPPFKDVFSKGDSHQMISAINNFKPDILFVGMTAPKQEKWVYEHVALLNSKIVCSVGAVFDFYAETVRRPPAFWVSMRLEWFVRLVMEPKRLWKRYLYYSPQFFVDVISKKT